MVDSFTSAAKLEDGAYKVLPSGDEETTNALNFSENEGAKPGLFLGAFREGGRGLKTGAVCNTWMAGAFLRASIKGDVQAMDAYLHLGIDVTAADASGV